MGRTRKHLRKLIAILLTFAMTLASLSIPTIRSEAKADQYISEVKLGYGETAEEAAKDLLAEGYTILTSEEKNTDVAEAYQSYADLNKGGSSGNAIGRKGTAIVYLGYKTTDKPEEAITDLATMNMKGGYSFADYQKLMEQHKNQVVRPFLEKFMGTIKEYRANYNGSNEDNKAKARLIHDVLNKIIDDDTGMGMGDLFLAETKDEMGDEAWSGLSDEEKKKHGDLTTILVQAQGDLVTLMEQLLTFAADTSENTWMDRFLAYSEEGLEKQYLDQGMTKTDAEKKLAEQYGDTAKALADKWEYLRDDLQSYRDSKAGQELEQKIEQAKSEAGSEDRGESEGTEEEKVPTREERKAAYEEPVDVEEDPEFEEKAESIPEVTDIPTAIEATSTVLELQIETMEENEESNLEALFLFLNGIAYGEGTLLDFFLQPASEVTGDKLGRLYPIAAALSEGQKAGLDFLSLEHLLQLGITDNVAYTVAVTKLEEAISGMGTVSVYEGVNRELFSDGVALTSEALRKNPGNASLYNESTLGISVVYNSLFLLGGIASGFAFKLTLNSISYFNKRIAPDLRDTLVEYNQMMFTQSKNAYRGIRSFMFSAHTSLENVKVTYSYNISNGLNQMKLTGWKDALGNTPTKVIEGNKELINESLGSNVGDAFDTLVDKTREYKAGIVKAQKLAVPWGRYIMAGVFFVTMLGLTAYSVYNTWQEMRAYYHQEMTKVPKYIVDEADITVIDEKGNKTFVRNDTAYYQAVLCNRKSDSEDYAAMKDFGDLNGDVGKQWLVLYTLRNSSGPILADSLKVVTGNHDMPEGYSTGIHMIGLKSAVNLTDDRYTYNDDMKGIYVYFKNGETSATGTASAFGSGVLALVGAGGVLVGVILGAVIAVLIKKKKEEVPEEEEE